MFDMRMFGRQKLHTDRLIEQAAVHLASGNVDASTEIYQAILRDDPNNVVALNEMGRIFLRQKSYAEAITNFRKAVSVRPDIAFLHQNLAAALSQIGAFEDSFASYRQLANLTYASADAAACADNVPMAAHKVLHDQEQRDYLRSMATNKPHATYHPFVIQPAGRVEGSAVNPNISTDRVMGAWQQTDPKIAVIDDVLTEKALQRLRQFCWGSTVWNRVYKNGYLGALPEHGFGSPLLAQIIEELKVTLSPALGDLPLLQFWAFKYSSGMKGVDLHADFSAVNINLWITPDEATDDPEGGGLIVWDKPAPLDWDFETYNQNEKAARDYLAASGAKPTIIPYRSNRAIVFDPSLFHETDRINFKPGYLNRRINITLLFGRRDE